MSSIKIENVRVDGRRVNILIKDSKIAKITEDMIDEGACEVIDGGGKVALPAFVNMHTHAGMTLFRGISEDMPLKEWLDEVWRAERNLTPEFVYWGTRLAALEMIKTGTSTFADMYWNIDRGSDAVVDSGLRASISYCFLDGGDKSKQEKQRHECEEMYHALKEKSDRVYFSVSIHAHYTVSDENMLWAARFARDHGLLIHTHLSETRKENEEHLKRYGVSPAARLADMGILGEDLLAAHSLWLDDEDIALYGKNRVTAIHNINSNLKLSSGYRFRYRELCDAGANVTIGTDGCGSSNNLDMREAMKTSAIVQKAWREDPTAMPMNELMQLASLNGAKALRIDSGVLKEGALADIILIDTDSTFFIPDYNFTSNFIYSANSSCVDTLICNGRVLMRGRRVEGEEEIMARASEEIDRFIKLI